jgi:hypothetical protein
MKIYTLVSGGGGGGRRSNGKLKYSNIASMMRILVKNVCRIVCWLRNYVQK